MITLQNPIEVKEPEKIIGTVVQYQITGFSFIDESETSYARVVVKGFDVDGKAIQTLARTIGADVISGSPEYAALHSQVRDVLEAYLIGAGVIPAE